MAQPVRGVPGLRPGTASRNAANVSTVTGRPPGTATRLTTGMVRQLGIQDESGGRPGTRGGLPQGAGVGAGLSVQVQDRPITQQGLGGMSNAGKGPHRVVQDRTYFLGKIRTKMAELSNETQSIRHQIMDAKEEHSTYLTYEKRAEGLAKEIRDLQAQMGDYNTLVDKLNTNDDIQDIRRDYEELKAKNAHETRAMDSLYNAKQVKDKKIHDLEVELEQERKMADSLVADMPYERQQQYADMKKRNEALQTKLERLLQTQDELHTRKADLEDSIAMSSSKQDAVRLYEQIHELEEKRDALQKEMQAEGSPQEQRERLLAQVKRDNQEIASMNRQINDLKERSEGIRDEITQIDQDLEENQGERSQKYQELKKREQQMNEFFETFEANKQRETEKLRALQSGIVSILDETSRKIGQFDILPSPEELITMRDDLEFKEREMKLSKTTATGLDADHQKLQSNLQRIEGLESKIQAEKASLLEKITKMESELIVYKDIDKLKADAEHKKQRLTAEKNALDRQVNDMKAKVEQLTKDYDSNKSKLESCDAYIQLAGLEQKWLHYEQNNFSMREVIEQKTAESDFRAVRDEVVVLLEEIHDRRK